eukprot:Amastigsp_a11383_16.p4 type:complete len:166 gc:universal Amastigsp_a11383_16:37-534(+)
MFDATVALGGAHTAVRLRPPASEHECMVLGTAFASMDPWARLQSTPESLCTFLHRIDGCSQTWVVETLDGRLAGAVNIRPVWLRGPYMAFLGILPEFQGQGLGSAIVAWFTDAARLAGARNAWICVSMFNRGARVVYERAGFSAIAQLDDLVVDGESEVLLRKRL